MVLEITKISNLSRDILFNTFFNLKILALLFYVFLIDFHQLFFNYLKYYSNSSIWHITARICVVRDFKSLHYQTYTLFINCCKVQIYQIAPHYVYLLLTPGILVSKSIIQPKSPKRNHVAITIFYIVFYNK